MNSGAGRLAGEKWLGIDRRRALPAFAARTLAQMAPAGDALRQAATPSSSTTLLRTTTSPRSAWPFSIVLRAAGVRAGLGRHQCCGRPQISKGLLGEARTLAERNADALLPHAAAGRKIVFCEPSCLSAVREDAPSLLRGEARKKAEAVAAACVLFEEFGQAALGNLPLKPGPAEILLHGHCHQKSMGLLAPAKSLLARIPGSTVVDLDAGCCGMAGSFGYAAAHFDVSRAIGERKLLPAVRNRKPGTVVVAAGTSCRHQVKDFTGERAIHPAVLLRSLLDISHFWGRLQGERMNLAYVSLAALVLAILVSCFTELNVGILALALAWIVGVYLGGMTLNEVIAGFPVALFLTLSGRDAAVLAGATERHARPHCAPRRAHLPRERRDHSGDVLRARSGAGLAGSR